MNRIFARFLSNSTKTTIASHIKSNDIVVFMKGTPTAPQCGFSRAVVQVLQANGIERFGAVNVLEDQEIRQGIKEYSEWPTIPQVYIKGEFVGGCDVVVEMHRSGELEELLVREGIVERVDEGESK